MQTFNLPIDDALPRLAEALAGGHAVLSAPTGSGKTTAVPLALLDSPWLAGRKIILLEPRRPAARMAARRMAQLLSEPVGERVGYQVRMERRIGPATRIEVLTEGLLTRRLQSDPELQGVGLVIFDEYHERSLQADLGLALCLDICAGLREDLRILVMSATLDAEKVAGLLRGQVVRASGSSYPVEVKYLAPADRREPLVVMPGLVQQALSASNGDVLAFLPGRREITSLHGALVERLPASIELVSLFGDLSAAEQDRVLGGAEHDRRRVILATDIAETSLTIPGITAVVDSGLARKPRFDPNAGMSRLVLDWVAQASAAQRSGRAGRVAPGICLRAWGEARQQRLAADIQPELLQADLAPLVLELALWGVHGADELGWLDRPPEAAWQQAKTLLQRLDALDQQGRITRAGRGMASLGMHPRLAHLLVSARNTQELQLATDLAALLSERDPMRGTPGMAKSADLGLRLQALAAWRGGTRPVAGFDGTRLQALDRLSQRWRRSVPQVRARGEVRSAAALLTLAFPDRVAQRRSAGDGRYRLAGGRGASLPADDGLASSALLAVAELDAGRREGRIWSALALDESALREAHPAGLVTCDVVYWDRQREAVAARSEQRFGDLVLHSRARPLQDKTAAGELLLEQLAVAWPASLPWDERCDQLQTRVAIMRRLEPEAGWPDLSSDWLRDHLSQWLGPWLDGVTSFKALRGVDLSAALDALLGWELRQRLDRQLPVMFQTPAGSRRNLSYAADQAPVLAVPLQEMFGQQQTPALASGRLPVLLHLLSPAQRPLQITQDLAHFWATGYKEVRKELKGRYPKHDWPADPATAQARRGTGRRRR